MLNSANRANEAVNKCIVDVLLKDPMFKIVWESVENKVQLKAAMVNIVQHQIEEYAGNRPIEPDVKVVLQFPDSISSYKELYWKDKLTGALYPIEIRRKDGN